MAHFPAQGGQAQQGGPSPRSLTLAVTGAANNGSGLVRLTVTAGSRALRSGDPVLVAAVGGVPNANGAFTVTAVSGTQYDLVGSAFAGSYTSGGTVKRTG